VTAEDSDAVLEQAAVGRVPDRGLDHGGVDAHAAALGDATFDRHRHDALEECAQLGAVDRLLEPHERRRVRHTLGPDPAEVPIADVAAHLALEGLEGPVTEPPQNEHPEHDLGRCALTSPRRALRAAPAQRGQHRFDEGLVIEQLIHATQERIDEGFEIVHHAEAHDLGEQELPVAETNGHGEPGTSSGEISPYFFHPIRSSHVLGGAVAVIGSASV
jgi:hypothetical protein